jgi:elongator complex protein 3
MGKEYFISIEDKNNIYGFCRLRFPSTNLRKEITKNSALVRELHVYGSALKVGGKGDVQHKGLGKQLLDCAEKICKKKNKNKIVVISGIGAREYYKKLGYKKQGPYMIKKL